MYYNKIVNFIPITIIFMTFLYLLMGKFEKTKRENLMYWLWTLIKRFINSLIASAIKMIDNCS